MIRIFRSTCLIALGALIALASVNAGAESAGPAAPTTRPAADQRIAALIADLADPSFNVRDKASQELTALGDAALPALKEALKSEDPSIRSYAEHLVKRHERRSAPPQQADYGRGSGQIRIGRANRGRLIVAEPMHRAVHVNVRNGVKNTRVIENGRTIDITEGPEGIQMTVATEANGKEEKVDYAAKNLEELKEKHPEAAKLYERHGVQAGFNGARINVLEGGVQLEGILDLNNQVLRLDDNLQGIQEIGRAVEQLKQHRQNLHEQLRLIEQERQRMVDELKMQFRADPQQ